METLQVLIILCSYTSKYINILYIKKDAFIGYPPWDKHLNFLKSAGNFQIDINPISAPSIGEQQKRLYNLVMVLQFFL